jgi:hypothetical protein
MWLPVSMPGAFFSSETGKDSILVSLVYLAKQPEMNLLHVN